MITVEELAEELNRATWAVEKMLKNRGYLKKNGDPTKYCINSGYMNKNGLITKAGESVFIDDLGIKEASEEDDELDDDELEDYDESDEEENDETGNDSEDIETLMREKLTSYGMDSDYLEDIISSLVNACKSEECEDLWESYCNGAMSWYNEGHISAFVIAAFDNGFSYSCFDGVSDVDSCVHHKMSDEDCV